jgi:hypothetical protein
VGIAKPVIEQERLAPVMVNIIMKPPRDLKTKPESFPTGGFDGREAMSMSSRLEAPPTYIQPTCTGV